MKRFGNPSQGKGSALILVLWCLLLLGIVVFSLVEMVELSVEHTSKSELVAEARALATSGLSIGLSPQLLKDDPLLTQNPADGQQFKVTIRSEGARLNLNYILQSNHREILVTLFNRWGLHLDQAEQVADCLYDWITPGDLRSLNGAKAADYAKADLPQRPTGKPFDSFEEVDQVMNMDMIDKVKPDWQDSFTLWSSGPLNVEEAPSELIAAVFAIDPSRVAYFTNARDGKDGIAGTSDDVPIKDITTLQRQLGLSDVIIHSLGGQISFNDPYRRIQSVGQASGTQVTISVVTPLNSSPIQYLLWSEQ